MRKIKKLLSIFTAALVAVSLALSSGVASALSVEEIRSRIRDLIIYYDQEVFNRTVENHDGWLNLFSDVLGYAEATEADATVSEDYSTESWVDWIMRADGFKAVPNSEENNLRAMLTNFGHNDSYWQSNWRVKNDFKLLTDWGTIYYTVQNREGQEKPYKGVVYDEARFLRKIREIYNLDPATNARKHDVLCLRALFRAMVEYDRFLGVNHEESLDSFVDEMMQKTDFVEQLILLLANADVWKITLQTNDDFSLMDRLQRQNASDVYKKIAVILIAYFYNAAGKFEHRDYEIIFDDNGYVVRIEPIARLQGGGESGNPGLIIKHSREDKSSREDKLSREDRSGQAGKFGAVGGGGRIIKGTGSGIDHFSAAVVALAVSVSGIAGLGYVVSRKKRKNVK